MLYGLQKRPRRPGFHSQFMDGFTGMDILEDFPYRTGSEYGRSTYPAVNILEYDKDYSIELAAPGLCKQDYEITLEKDVLKIATIKDFDSDQDASRYSRREFAQGNFEKTFVLPENADTEAISASCSNGILNIHIPKKVIDTNPKTRSINIK